MNIEMISGQRNYYEILRKIHEYFVPDLYLEIGVRNAESLKLSRGPAIGIDPLKQFDINLNPATIFYEMTSDDFFLNSENYINKRKIDLAFIDGMHLFEYALRDFINIESLSHPCGLIVLDDVCPNHPLQASRERKTNVWTGDVWKLRDCLKRYRPDLTQVLIDTSPTGLLMVLGLDSTNTILLENYYSIISEYAESDINPPPHILNRSGALPPSDDLISSICSLMLKVKNSDRPNDEMHSLHKLFSWMGL